MALFVIYTNRGDQVRARKINRDLTAFGINFRDETATVFALIGEALLDQGDGKQIDTVLKIERELTVATNSKNKYLIGEANDVAGYIYSNVGDCPAALQHQLLAIFMREGHCRRDELC